MEVPDRMLAPLAVLDAAGPLGSKLQLRLLTLLVQREYGGGAYRPDADGYWPSFDALDMDILRSPDLVKHSVAMPSKWNSRFRHSYRITPRGAKCLRELVARTPRDEADGMMRTAARLASDMPVALLEEAQSVLGPKEATSRLEERVEDDLERTTRPILDAYANSISMHAIALAEILKTAKKALSKTRHEASDGAQRRVILLLAGEIARECRRLGVYMEPRGSTQEDPRIADADDLASNLIRYCEAKGVSGADPMAMPLSKVLSEERARKLCEDMLKA